MTLNETLDAVARREQAQRLDQGEAAVHAKIADQLPPPPELDAETREALAPWINWTTQKSCRYAPAKPYVVAAYLLDQAATGATTGALLRRAHAITVLHDRHNLSDPVNTTCVRTVLGDLVATEAPRSFNKEEKAEFAMAPVPVQRALSRIERSRELNFRQRQNEIAEERKRLQADAEPKSVNTSEGNENARTTEK